MKTVYIFILMLLFSLQSFGQQDQYIKGDLIVQFKPGYGPSDIIAGFESVELKSKQLLSKRMNIWLLQYNSELISDYEMLFNIKDYYEVQEAQYNHVVQLRGNIDLSPRDTFNPENPFQIFPNDPRFNEQWALHNTGQSGGTPDADIDAPEAWQVTTGGVTAAGDTIVAAIIDGGAYLTHPDVNYWFNYGEIPNNGIDDDGNGYIDDYRGWNAYNNTGNVPNNSHGTHVSGITGAKGNNNLGVSGVNWGVKIMPIAGSSGNEATVIAAYGYVHEMRSLYNETNGQQGAFIVVTNASFGVDYGQPANYPLWCAIYDSLGVQGVLSCGATANLNINIDVQGDVPTACPSDYLVSVTNTTRTDSKNSGAAYGLTTIDLGAPGTSILSTDLSSSYTTKTGTSMATPTVTGVIALMFAAANQDFIAAYKENPGQYALIVKEHLLTGTDPIPALQGITVTGGRLNANNAVLNISQHIIPVELTSFTADVWDNKISLRWSTASETNNKGFELQRRSAEEEWSIVAFITGNGNSAAQHDYSYTDKNVSPGSYTYRLKQIDFDGTYSFSKEVNVDVTAPATFLLSQNYPNPFNPSTTISFSLPEKSDVKLVIYNVLGQAVTELYNGILDAGYQQVVFNASEMPSGTYIYRLTATGESNIHSASRKMILVK